MTRWLSALVAAAVLAMAPPGVPESPAPNLAAAWPGGLAPAEAATPKPRWTPKPKWTPRPKAKWIPRPKGKWTPRPKAKWTPRPKAKWTPRPGSKWKARPKDTRRKVVAKPTPRPKQPAPAKVVKAGGVYHGPGYSLTVPAGWTLRTLPTLGKPPRETRRAEIVRAVEGGRATIDLEADRSDGVLGPKAVPVLRAIGQATAQNFGFRQYRAQDLRVKGAPGFYESWVAQPPGGRPPFRVVAAHMVRGGVHYRVGAVCPLGGDLSLVERDMRQVLKTWRWAPAARAPRRP